MNSKFAVFFSVLAKCCWLDKHLSSTAEKSNFMEFFEERCGGVAANDQQPKDENRT